MYCVTPQSDQSGDQYNNLTTLKVKLSELDLGVVYLCEAAQAGIRRRSAMSSLASSFIPDVFVLDRNVAAAFLLLSFSPSLCSLSERHSIC